MWSNFSLALSTLLGTVVFSFLWAVAVFYGGDSIALKQVDTALALRNLMFYLAAFWMLCVVAYLPVRRPVIIKLLIGTGLILLGAWQELLGTLAVSPWLLVRWIELISLPAGTLIIAFSLYQLGKAYQLNRLLLGSYRKIEHDLATVDQVTQVYNRRYFFSVCPDLMHVIVSSAHEQTHKPAIILLKIANLPDINQSLGFQAGDNVLTHTGQVIQRHIRGQDMAARLGGRTFAIFLPQATEAEAEELAERLQERSRHLLISLQEDEDVSCTIKLNYILRCAEAGEGFEQLLSRTKLAYREQYPKTATPDN